jgi:hypothetical protein
MKIILGMHRSGTSLIAGLLYKCGLNFGNKNNFITPDKFNPYGYFENIEVININKKLLHGIFGRLNYLFPSDFKNIKKRFFKHKKVINFQENNFMQCYVKDNRFCLTMSVWPKKIKFIIFVVRHPQSIAKSLKIRNFIPEFWTYKLWRIHILSALKNSRNIRKLFVSYENLLDANKRFNELKKISDFILKIDLIYIDPKKMEQILINNFHIDRYSKNSNDDNISLENKFFDKKNQVIWKYLCGKITL